MNDLTEEAVRRALGKYHDLPIEVLPAVTSTNTYLKQAARKGARGFRLVIAETQTAGRGRLGHSFLSPSGTGLYMSLLLPLPESGLPVTLLAAVAVCQAIEEKTEARPLIKWVNDLFVRGKKVCGILAEAVEDQVIAGIGVNVRTPEGGFPGVPAAGALDAAIRRDDLAGCIAANLLTLLERPDDPAILEAYRARMPLIGAEIAYESAGKIKKARVLNVDKNGGLAVVSQGRMETLRAGEISLGSDYFSSLLNKQPQ